jgi:lipopolysaccharide export system protein LptC
VTALATMGPPPDDVPEPGAPDEPGGPPELGEPRRPPSGLAARRRLVVLLRVALPLAALLLIALVVVWPHFQDQDRAGFALNPASVDPREVEQLTMVKPRFVGRDSKEEPYTLTAISATQDHPGADLIHLDHPQADITLSGGSWAIVTALKGTYAQKDQILDLEGDIAVFHDSGYEFHTQKAEVDLAHNTINGVVPVTGQGPGGTIEAENGFTILDNGGTVLFHGPAKTTLNPRAKGLTTAPSRNRPQGSAR